MKVDPRGLRFAAWLTTALLVAVLVTGSGWLLLNAACAFCLACEVYLLRHRHSGIHSRNREGAHA